ncbi:hypothetical protein [Chengkuizengella sediminis]|nr:hypothetical protein [Chengkuizengella sediminis]NDI33540.1 hypothetical protein [Chengkuizengella sediminis]
MEILKNTNKQIVAKVAVILNTRSEPSKEALNDFNNWINREAKQAI